ncbi:HesB/IscA family protein [Wolbachia endosymbiont of Howardula sp.]|uniref:HesB/IscA family protein n=1 Tax=Wolbachia endosymbiont of Howardula sp. TaxID=2916816 RepID=UPI00217D61B6|nr:iron-sulfur cluster biosynthesis family protein [Wolbachia endosymbiont of Howardula sp.]UWI83306.1 heme biosynthesis protein HemY [Wolbachia endosymbiont of Howardula sp.]
MLIKENNITCTESAVQRIHYLISQEKNKESVLRITVSGGGCSGFKYNFLMDHIGNNLSDNNNHYVENKDHTQVDDRSIYNDNIISQDIIIYDREGMPILICDVCSARFLNNSVIDYIENLSSAGFHIHNSLVKSKCGCGKSFAL